MSAQWKPISPSEATSHPLYGVKGWLLVFTVGHFLGPLLNLGRVNSIAFQNNISLGQLLSINAPEIFFMKAALLMELALSAVVLYLLFTKNAQFRLVAIFGRLSFWPLLGLVALSQGISETGKTLAVTFFTWAVSCAVWVTYLQRSKRVRVTFEHCVRAEEALNVTKPDKTLAPYMMPATVAANTTGFEDRSASEAARSSDLNVPQHSFASQSSPSTISTDTQMDEDTIYATVAEELESGKTDKGLWTRLFAESEGDENRTKVSYIKRRVEKLIVAKRARREQFALEKVELQKQLAIDAKNAERLRLKNVLDVKELITAVSFGDCQIVSARPKTPANNFQDCSKFKQ
jgi:hypothetical protein